VVPAEDIRFVPLSWGGDVRTTSPSNLGAPRERGKIGVTCSSSRLLERSRSTGDDLRIAVPSLRRVTLRVTLASHHPTRRARFDVASTAPTGGIR
jgi:hypothetical protein